MKRRAREPVKGKGSTSLAELLRESRQLVNETARVRRKMARALKRLGWGHSAGKGPRGQ